MARDPGESERLPPYRTRHVRRIVAMVAAIASIASIASILSLRQAAPPPTVEALPMRYTGEFRYDGGSPPVWSARERVELTPAVLRRVDAAGRVGVSEEKSRGGSTPRMQRIASSALAPEWRYVGTRGVRARVHVYRRERRVLVRVPPSDDTVHVVNQVSLPIIERGRIQLEPDRRSTMRFSGPRRLLRATSPGAKAERFGDEVAYTIPLGELVGSGRDPRVLVGDPEPPRKSFVERLGDWASGAMDRIVDWITSLIGLIIAAAVTAVVGPIAVREWNKRQRAGRHLRR